MVDIHPCIDDVKTFAKRTECGNQGISLNIFSGFDVGNGLPATADAFGNRLLCLP